PRKKKRKH
nr:Chain D, PRO-ARG-LYS-LYS-LYS-ARG-LYS-HIS [Homo sapiens]